MSRLPDAFDPAAELTDADRAGLDADARRAAEALRGGEGAWLDEALAGLDAAEPLPRGMAVRSRRQAERAVRQWALARNAPPVATLPGVFEGQVWRVARWPLGAAAALVVGLIVWVYANEPIRRTPPAIGMNPSYQPEPGDGGRTREAWPNPAAPSGGSSEPGPVPTPAPSPAPAMSADPLLVAMLFEPLGTADDARGEEVARAFELGSDFSDELNQLRVLREDWLSAADLSDTGG